MEDALPWILVLVLAVVSVILFVRLRGARAAAGRAEAEARRALGELRDARWADDDGPAAPAETMGADEQGADERTAATESAPVPSTGATRELLQDLLEFLERRPLARLREAEQEQGDRLPAPVLDALDALEDLAFYGAMPDDTVTRQDLGDLVRGVTREYGEQHGVRIRVSGPERSVSFDVAGEWLKDIVYLVLSNADHFGGEGGIHVRLEGGPAVAAVVEVRDDGDGFDEAALEHAFEPFWTTDPQAPGLGLFHCRVLVEHMGGRLDLDNHPEGGGRVRLLLPEAPPNAEGR